jgi:ABC-type branched-subunit amino acid transport system substrate-binding protein
VQLALAKHNLKPVAIATVERNSVDVAKAVETINAASPEAVVQISAYTSCAAYIRAARKAGYGGGFYNVSFVGTQALADELGKFGAGVVVSQVVPSPYSGGKAISREFADAVRRSNGAVQSNYSSMEGYIAAKVLAEGLRRSGGKGGADGLMTALESINNMSMGGFNVNFSKADHVASTFVEMSMLTGDGKVRV